MTSVEKGSHAANLTELVATLTGWLGTRESTIGDASRYGGTPWISVESPVGPVALNADTTRDAVRRFLQHCRRGGASVDCSVIENRRGSVNKVEFDPSGTPTPGWYMYTRKPLAAPTSFRWTSAFSAPSPGVFSAAATRSSRVDDDAAAHACIVQFPHPGAEHVPKTDEMQWNAAPHHRRKFLRAAGSIVDADGRPVERGDVVFWGEWEAQSRVVERWPAKSRREPRALHEPFWVAPSDSAFRQNTDPWVFGESFLYSNCKQLTQRHKPSALQRLAVGSVILFGSVLDGDFVLDTVFVVGEVIGTWEPARFPYEVGDAFEACTADPLLTCPPEVAGATFTLYRGATPLVPVHGMFSFVPCKAAGSTERRFARPVVSVPGVLNPASRQAASGAKRERPIAEVAAVWASVVDQVQRYGNGLGVDLAVPPQEQRWPL